MNAATGTPWQDNIGEWLIPPRRGWGNISPPSPATWPIRASTRSARLHSVLQRRPLCAADTNLPNTQSFRLPAIQRVLRVVSQRLHHTRAFLGADVFPISFIVADARGSGSGPR